MFINFAENVPSKLRITTPSIFLFLSKISSQHFTSSSFYTKGTSL
nr:MAG TPA: hypothetical protein [Caudoviricetes sp.]